MGLESCQLKCDRTDDPTPKMVCRYRVYSRAWQQFVQAEMYDLWFEREGVDWSASLRETYFATWGLEPSTSYLNTKLKQHYKTHCDKVYGGEIWLKMLIAFGRIPNAAVNIANLIVNKKVMHKVGAGASTLGEEWPIGEEAHWRKRGDRAEASPPPTSSPKCKRRAADNLLKHCEDDWRTGILSEDEYNRRRAEAMQLRKKAYAFSKAFQFLYSRKFNGKWRMANGKVEPWQMANARRASIFPK